MEGPRRRRKLRRNDLEERAAVQPDTVHHLRSRAVLALPAVVLLLATGCGGSSKPSVCDERDAVKTSVNDLLKVNPVTDGLDAVKTKLNGVNSSVKSLAGAAGDQYQPQISALQTSLKTLTSQINALGSNPSVTALAAIPASAQQVGTDLSALTTAIGSAC
jgi:hypothetical protein